MKRFLIQAAIVLVVSSCVVMAQDQKLAPQPSVSLKIDASTLLLEISDIRAVSPGYSEVNAPGETTKGIWFGSYTRIPGREVPGKPIRAVRFEPVLNGEMVDVKVTLLRGSKGFEQEDLVGLYQVGIGEQKSIKEFEQFGIEPFNIALLHTVFPLPPSPGFENLTKAVEIVSVQAENIPKPAYKLALRNVSDKNVLVVRIETFHSGRRATAAWAQGEDGRVFLPPGGVAERRVLVTSTERTPTGYAPGTPSAVTIKIATVVFDDLSFEGESETACTTEGFVMGRRLFLKQVLAILDQEISKSNSDHVEAARQFKAKLAALSSDFDESQKNKVSSVAPACPKPLDAATVAVNGMKVDLLREVERIITANSAPPVNFKSWMEERRTRYSAWLGRL